MKGFRAVCLILAAIPMLFLFAACGKKDAGYAPGAHAEEETSSSDESPGSALEIGEVVPGQKIIYYVKYSIETLDFDVAVKKTNALVSKFGGYIQSSNITGKARSSGAYTQPRTASYTLRIPTERLNEFFDAIGGVGSIRSESLTTENVSLKYTDIEARLKSLEVQEERILEMLSKAESLEYVLELESRLSEIRYEIENYTSKLNRYDSLILYSTVTILLSEVYELTVTEQPPKTFGEKLSQRFNWNFMTGFALWFLGNIVEIVIVAGLIVLAVSVIVRLNKRAEKKRPKFPFDNENKQ